MSGYRQHRPFTALSRRLRRKKTIVLKNLIYRERHRCGGVFYDECDFSLFEGENGSADWGWSDIFFLGRDPATFWNAEIITAQVAFSDAVGARAFDEAWAMLNEQERKDEASFDTRPCFNAQGKIAGRTLIPRQRRTYACFAGLTFSHYIDKREREIARDDPPAIYCGYQFLPDYAYGLGLRIIVAAPALSQRIIEEAIADFRLRGEREWRSATGFSVKR